MAKFRYKGKSQDGTEIEQVVEVNDRYDVYEIARKNGHEVLSISEVGSWSLAAFIDIEKINAALSRVKRDELVMFTRNLSAMLKAGLALTRALSVAERQTKNPKMRAVLISLREAVSKGDPFHSALAQHPKEFSRLYIAMVRAGEEGGTLSEALSIVGLELHRSSELRKKVRGAMTYPAIVIGVMCIIGVLMMMYVVPTLTATFKEMNIDLPVTTRVIIAISDFLSTNSLMALVLMVGTITGFVMAFRTQTGRRLFEWTLLRVPVVGTIAREVNAARTARTLSSLLSSGVDVVGALNITADVVQNSFYKEIIKEAAVRVEKGKALSETFVERIDLYPVLLGEMIAVGEETGQIANMLMEVADFYESEVDRKTKDLSTIIEPLLMVVIGGGVGFFALAMIAPIYSISDGI